MLLILINLSSMGEHGSDYVIKYAGGISALLFKKENRSYKYS